MPRLNGKLTDENCPDCLHNGKKVKLVEIIETWDMEEEGDKDVILNQCPCGYRKVVSDYANIIGNDVQKEGELKVLRGEEFDNGYRLNSSFLWIREYFNNFSKAH